MCTACMPSHEPTMVETIRMACRRRGLDNMAAKLGYSPASRRADMRSQSDVLGRKQTLFGVGTCPRANSARLAKSHSNSGTDLRSFEIG